MAPPSIIFLWLPHNVVLCKEYILKKHKKENVHAQPGSKIVLLVLTDINLLLQIKKQKINTVKSVHEGYITFSLYTLFPDACVDEAPFP